MRGMIETDFSSSTIPVLQGKLKARTSELLQSMLILLCTFLQSDWNVVKRGWEAHVLGEAPNKFTDPVEAIKTLKVQT